MDKTITVAVSCGDAISIVFKLNVLPLLNLVAMAAAPRTHTTRKYYGELFIHQKTVHDAPPILLKSYEFTNFTQIFPVLKKIAATNFIENIQHVISMLQFILYNNENPWLRLEKTSDATPPTPPTPYYVNLKTNESFWELPAGIHPWTTYANEDGTYYVNSSMNETSLLNPVEQQGTHLNVVLNQIIYCLQNGKTQSDLKSEIDKTLGIRRQEQEEAKKAAEEAKKAEAEQRRLAARTEMMNMNIDSVFVISGHSICGRRRMDLKDPNMIVVTLSKLYDKIHGSNKIMYDNGSGIIKAFESSQPYLPTVSSIVDMLVELRSKKLIYPKKVQEGSIRVRRGRSGSQSNNTLTEQFFYGGTRVKDFREGVFMYSKDRVVDISSLERLLTPTGKKNLYEETTDFQKRIIDFESKHPDESTDLDLERQFAAESKVAFDAEEFKTEWENLQLQRRLFCNSLNFIDSIVSCVMSCKGIDVMVLQKYYDSIVEWEKRNRKSAFEYFEEDKERIKKFMEESGLDQNDKKIEGLLMMLSDKRKQQLIKESKQRKSKIPGRKVEPLELIENDFQSVPSLYEQASSSDILQKINSIALFSGQKKLVILEGCRGVVDEHGNKVKGIPDDSEHEVEDYNEDLGGARQNYKINRKNTNKKKKNAFNKKKNTHSKKKKKIKSCNNKK